MFIYALALVFANVLVAEELIAFVTLGANRVATKGRPVVAMNMMRDGYIAGVMFGMHSKTFRGKCAESIPHFRQSGARIQCYSADTSL